MKKYLNYILLSLLCIFSFLPRVYAKYNSDTTYTLELFDFDTFFESINCGNDNVKVAIDNLIESTDFENNNFELMIYYTYPNNEANASNDIGFFLVPKYYIQYNNFSLHGFNGIGSVPPQLYFTQSFYNSSATNAKVGYFEINVGSCSSNSIDLTSSTPWINFKNTLQNGDYNSRSSNASSSIGGFWAYDFNGSVPHYEAFAFKQHLSTSLNNNDSFTIPNFHLPYFSSIDMVYTTTSTTSTEPIDKNLIIDGVEYASGDTIPDYYTISHTTPTPSQNTFVDYKTRLDTFYTNLLPQNVSSYNLNVQFNTPNSILGYSQDPQDYIDNLNFDYICSGRVNYTDYYQYESFPCSLTMTSSYSSNRVTLNFSNLSYSTSLINFDKIYVTINTNYYDDSLNKIIYQTETTFTGGNVYNTQYKGTIYENLDSLPLNFKLYMSSNNTLVDSNVYMFKYAVDYKIKIVGFSNTSNQQNLVVGHSILGTNNINSETNNDPYFSNFQVSNNIDTGIMIYQDNSIIQIPRLELFFNSGITLTINQSNNSTFYYIDSDGNIVSHSLTISYNNENNSTYDITYYVNIVNSFLNDLTEDSLELATLTQNFYDSMPVIFQAFIFVSFILFCVYFTYLLIKKE